MARPTLFGHRKLFRLARDLGSRALAIGHLEILWAGAYESGEPVLGDPTDVELLAEWDGEPGALARALLDAGGPGRPGFLDVVGGGLLAIHDFWDHAPDYVRRRAEREQKRQDEGKTISDKRREAADARWAKQRGSPATDMQTDATDRHLHATDMQTDATVFPPAPAPAPAPALEEAPPTGELAPRPTDATPAALGVGTKRRAEEDRSPILFLFPVTGDPNRPTWPLRADRIAGYEATFPTLDVGASTRRALAWIEANGPKTARGMPRFLVGWYGKAVDRGQDLKARAGGNGSGVLPDARWDPRLSPTARLQAHGTDPDAPPSPRPKRVINEFVLERNAKLWEEYHARTAAAGDRSAIDASAGEPATAHLEDDQCDPSGRDRRRDRRLADGAD